MMQRQMLGIRERVEGERRVGRPVAAELAPA